MIQIPYEDMIKKIEEKGNISKEEIESRIQEKMKQLSGFISKDGAAHIVANEMGVKLLDEVTGKLKIEKILPGMRSVETVGKVVAKFDVREFQTETREGKVGSLIVGDETGTLRIVCWGNQTDKLEQINIGDIIRIKDGYVKENRGNTEIHLNDRSLFQLNPPGETVGEVKSTISSGGEVVRKNIKDLGENDANVELLGTIVQTFEPKFFEVCPECNSRAKPQDGSYVCKQHGNVSPDYSYLINLYLDDGTDNIRTVFFRDQVEALLGKTKQDILVYKDNPEKFDEVKTEMLGNMIKVSGKSKKNEMFDRIEFTANTVNIKPDPEDELNNLKKNEG